MRAKETKKPSLQEEAKAYKSSKSTKRRLKPMTSRVYFAGQALSGLLARGHGTVRMAEMKREAYEWADYMLDDD